MTWDQPARRDLLHTGGGVLGSLVLANAAGVVAAEDPGTEQTFNFSVEAESGTVFEGEAVDITLTVTNLATEAISGVTVELLVDGNRDGQFTDEDVVASQTLDFEAEQSRDVALTYENVGLDPGEYDLQGRARKDGNTATSPFYRSRTLTVKEVQAKWRYSAEGAIRSSPTIVDGSLYVGSDAILSLDAATGDLQWKYEEAGTSSAVNVQGGNVFFGKNTHLVALDADTGEKAWEYETGAIVQSPTATEGTVYATSLDNNLHAVEMETGDQQWVFETVKPLSVAPTVKDGSVYFTGTKAGTHLFSIDTETGSEEWRFEIAGSPQSSATVANGVVYVGVGASSGFNDKSHVYAVDAETGDQVWSFDSGGGGIPAPPTVYDGTVFVGDIETDDGNKGLLYALDANTGDKLWEFDPPGGVEDGATVADDTVVIQASNYDFSTNEKTGAVIGIGVSSGEEQWRYERDISLRTSPTVVDGLIYASDEDSTMLALDEDIEGKSQDSRVNLGTLGHHDVWAQDGSGDDPGSDLPPVVGNTPPQDIDGDGLYEDVNGDGEVNIFDVQALFSNLDNDVVQNNPEAFNFSGKENPTEVTIFDVQALFNKI